MKMITKTLAATIAAGALALSGVTAAQAVTAEGGTWNYGVTGKYTYSNYHHGSRQHKATACGVGCTYADWTVAGRWAEAQAISAIGGNKAYYDVK